MSVVLGLRPSAEKRQSHLIAEQIAISQINSAGSFTVGYTVTIPTTIVIDQYEVLWTPSLASETIKVSMWDGANALIAASVATGTITTPGLHYLSLAAPVTLTAGSYTLGCHEITGTRYQRTNGGAFVVGRDYGNGMNMATPNLYAVGDGRPSLVAGAEKYGFFFARQVVG